jgi:hypothetical protein
VSLSAPGPGCHDLRFAQPYPLGDAAEVALEDYARAVWRARAAEAVRDSEGVRGVHVCGAHGPTPAARADVEAFARDLWARSGEGGLGWS